jgi:biotin carboxyl carrier protein
MKMPKVIGTAALLVFMGSAGSVYVRAQDDKPAPHDQDAKLPQDARPPQDEPKPQPDAKPKPEPEPDARPKPQPEPKPKPEAKPAKQEKQAQAPAQGKVNRGKQIPDDRYQAKFGQEHHFHGVHFSGGNGARRFAYGGYNFELVDAWPAGWAYTDEYYIIFVDGSYYLCDPNYPGVQIAIIVV